MRIVKFIVIFVLSSLFINSWATVTITIKGKQAKALYNGLTGPKVDQEGAAGHLYKQTKTVICRYTNADMDDNHGNPVSRTDPLRYACGLKFDNNGNAQGINP